MVRWALTSKRNTKCRFAATKWCSKTEGACGQAGTFLYFPGQFMQKTFSRSRGTRAESHGMWQTRVGYQGCQNNPKPGNIPTSKLLTHDRFALGVVDVRCTLFPHTSLIILAFLNARETLALEKTATRRPQ